MRKHSVVHAMREVVTGRRTAGGNEGQDRLPRRQGRIADGDQTFVPLRGLGSRQGANKGLHRLQRSRDRSGWPPLPAQRQVRHDCADRRPHARRRHAALTTAWRLCDLRASRKASRSATDVDRPAARVHFPDFVGMVGELSDCRRYPTRNRRRALYGQFRRRRAKSWQTRDECFAAAVSFSGVYLWDFVTRVTASGYSGLPQFRPCAPYAASSVHARHSVRESSQ